MNDLPRQKQGDRAQNQEQAIHAYEQALQVYTPQARPYKWARIMNNLGAAYSRRIQGDQAQNLEQAIQAYEQAQEIFRPESLPNECRLTAQNLGRLYFEERQWLDAIEPYQLALQAAENLYQASLLPGSRELELAETGNLYHRAAYALAHTDSLHTALVTLEQGRARGLSETLARDRANLEQVKIVAPDIYNSYQQAAARLRELETAERAASTQLAQDKVGLTPEELREQALQARNELNAAIEHIRQVPGYEDFLAQPDFDDIIEAVQFSQPLVYLVTTSAGSLALVVHQTAPPSGTQEVSVDPIWLNDFTVAFLRELLFGPADDPDLGGWFGAYDLRQEASQEWFDTLNQVTSQLWQGIMGPVVHHLKILGVEQAVLIPTGLLGLLPLHAAWTEEPTAPTGRRYALDTITFTYAPNARSLTAAQAIAAQTLPDLLLAVDEPQPVRANPLPNSKPEVQTAISTFPQHQIFRNTEATRSAVLSALPQHSVLHFSCHGYANFNSPLNSGLAMADDELLSLRDLLDLRLQGIRLAILSACETGLSGTQVPDEVISLPTGLLQAGVAGIVASLWSVSDISTMMLMARFYDLWRKPPGLEPPEALRQAQQWVRDTTNGEKVTYFQGFIPELAGSRMATGTADTLYQTLILSRPEAYDFAHPFHWAAFSYVGV